MEGHPCLKVEDAMRVWLLEGGNVVRRQPEGGQGGGEVKVQTSGQRELALKRNTLMR
jgi:hypothetical protein